MRKLFKFFLLIVSLPMLYAFVAQALLFLFSHFGELWSNWFLYGVIFYVILYAVLLWAKMDFLETFEHELGHTVVAFLFFNKVTHFFASSRLGGFVVFEKRSGAIGRTLITMAPYFLPVLTLPFLLIKPFMMASAHKAVDFFLGLTLAFHFIALSKEFRPSIQSDIQKVGLPYALATVVLFNGVFTVLTISFALSKYAYVFTYMKESFLAGWKIYVWMYMKLFFSTRQNNSMNFLNAAAFLYGSSNENR